MTETAAMMAVGTRADSNSSGNVWGQTLPGVEVRFSEDQEISVQTDALFRGYYPDDRDIGEFTTGDIGRWMPDKQLQVLGRKDFMINTGGEKVSPEEVETVLADFLPGIALAVTSRKDPEWGEQVVAVLEPRCQKIRFVWFGINWLLVWLLTKSLKFFLSAGPFPEVHWAR